MYHQVLVTTAATTRSQAKNKNKQPEQQNIPKETTPSTPPFWDKILKQPFTKAPNWLVQRILAKSLEDAFYKRSLTKIGLPKP
jgi:hypothetical protein